ncbi:MAG: hypothetical protein HY552_06595 [Elusimicrobia bacterium]|nr:hypothetical protein [Elusimicrobiota bacterium]
MRHARATAAGAVAAVLAGCAAPRPCTRALCPRTSGASYRVSGWSAPVTVTSGDPALPIVPDASVEVHAGPAEFVIDRATVTAETGAVFLFSVSPRPPAIPWLLVSSGSVTVASAAAPPAALTPGATYFLPAAR